MNLVKSEFACGTVTYLGHVVGKGEVKPINGKVEAVCRFPLMRFLGMVGFY